MPGRIGPFELTHEVGRGASAEVFAGRHEPTGRDVAVKIFKTATHEDQVAIASEVRAVAGLDHPCIVRVFDQGVAGSDATGWQGRPYVVMELATRGTLRGRLGRESWSWVRGTLQLLLEALGHAHARGVVHRDLKPGNVLLGGPRASAVLTDFGLAQGVGAAPAATDVVTGTPATMAPEQVDGSVGGLGPWTDLYALGCTGWAVLTGQFPFQKRSGVRLLEAHLLEALPDFRPVVDVPVGVEAWLRRLLEKAPGDRFLRAADARAALLRLGDVEEEEDEPVDDPSTQVDLSPRLPLRVPHGLGLGLWGMRRPMLVGRSREREVLDRSLREVALRRLVGGVVVRGAPGVGKSRLCESLCVDRHESGLGVLWLCTQTYGGGAEDGVEGMLRRAYGLPVHSSPLQAAERISSCPDIRPPDDVGERTDLARVASGVGAGMLSHERWELCARAIERSRCGEVQVVWLDDASWSLDTLGFALHLLGRAGRPMFLQLTARAEVSAATPAHDSLLAAVLGHPRMTVVDLEPLDSPASLLMMADMLELKPSTAVSVAERAGGNPLFMVQLVGAGVERGDLVLTEGGFAERAPLSAPADLEAVWRERITDLLVHRPMEDRVALEVAAVLGRTVDDTEWADACARVGCRPSRDLRAAMLERHLAVQSHAGEPWAFVHALLREVLMAQAGADGRLAHAHRAAAAALAGHDDLERLLRRQHHLWSCEEWSLGLDQAVPLGRRLQQQEEWPRLERLAGEVETAARAAGLGDDPRVQRVRLFWYRRLFEHGRRAESNAILDLVDEANRQPGAATDVKVSAQLQRAVLARFDGDPDRALVVAQEAAALALRGDDAGAVALAHATLGWLHLDRGELARGEELIRAHVDGLLDVGARISTSNNLAFAIAPSRQTEAAAIVEEAMALAERSGVRGSMSRLWSTLACVAYYAKDLDLADKRFREALRFATLAGRVFEVVMCHVNLGFIAANLGRWERSAAEFAAAYDVPGGSTSARQTLSVAEVGRWTAHVHLQYWSDVDRVSSLAVLYTDEGVVADDDHLWLLRSAFAAAQRSGRRSAIETAGRALVAAHECRQEPLEAQLVEATLDAFSEPRR